MQEQDLQHGVISKGKIRRTIRKALRPKLKVLGKAGLPFDWKPVVLPNIKIKDQMQSDSCGGQAGSYWLELVDKALSNSDVQFSAKSIYAPIAYPGGGTTVYALENHISKLGANFETDVPSYKPDGTTDESWMTDTSYLSPQIKQKALRDAFRVAVSVPIDLESMALAIQDSGGIIIEVQAKNGEIPSWLSPVPTPPSKTNTNPLWAHFLCGTVAGTRQVAGQVTTGQKVIGFANSWGNTVGQNGFQFFTEDYINSGYIVDCFTFYPITVTTGGLVNTGSWIYRIFEWMLHKFLA